MSHVQRGIDGIKSQITKLQEMLQTKQNKMREHQLLEEKQVAELRRDAQSAEYGVPRPRVGCSSRRVLPVVPRRRRKMRLTSGEGEGSGARGGSVDSSDGY